MTQYKSLDFDNLEFAFEYKTSKEMRKAHFLFSVINNPFISSVGSSLVKMALFLRLPVKGMIKKTIFDQFCGGESIHDSRATIDSIGKYKVKTILDYSVEGEVSEKGFDKTRDELLRVIEEADQSENIPFTVFKMTGMGAFKLLAKVQAGDALRPTEQEAYERVKERVDVVCGAAVKKGIPIMIDAEETWIQSTIDELVYAMMRKYNSEKAYVFNTFQMYRTDSLSNLMEASKEINNEGFYFGAKLVRGAYMEKERDRAEDLKYPSPIHATKAETDICFNDGISYCFEHAEKISVMCGSHNEDSNMLLARLMTDAGIAPGDQRFWFAQLYGMSDNISFNLAHEGFNVAKYVPYGPVLSVMPYLFRRAEENTSVAGQSSRELTMIKKELQNRKKRR